MCRSLAETRVALNSVDFRCVAFVFMFGLLFRLLISQAILGNEQKRETTQQKKTKSRKNTVWVDPWLKFGGLRAFVKGFSSGLCSAGGGDHE